jgi:hypothetical protein
VTIAETPLGIEVQETERQDTSPLLCGEGIPPRKMLAQIVVSEVIRSSPHQGQFGEVDHPSRLILIQSARSILLIPDNGSVGPVLRRVAVVYVGDERISVVLEPMHGCVETSRGMDEVVGVMRHQGLTMKLMHGWIALLLKDVYMIAMVWRYGGSQRTGGR